MVEFREVGRRQRGVARVDPAKGIAMIHKARDEGIANAQQAREQQKEDATHE